MAWKKMLPLEDAAVYVDKKHGESLTIYTEEYEYRRKPHTRAYWRYISTGMGLRVEIEGEITDLQLTDEKYTQHYKKKEVKFFDAIEYELAHCSESFTAGIISEIRGYDDGVDTGRMDFINIDPNNLSREELIDLVMEVQSNRVEASMEESKEEEK